MGTMDVYYKRAFAIMDKYLQFQPPKEAVCSTDFFGSGHFRELINLFPEVVCITDLPSRGYLYISENLKDIMGYDPSEIMACGLASTVKLFPPKHNEIILTKIFPVMFEYLEKYGDRGNVKDLVISYSSQMICRDGSVRWFIHKLNVLSTNEQNQAQLLLKVLSDITEVKKDNSMFFQINCRNEKGTLRQIYSQVFLPESAETFTNREVEILSLMGKGKSSKEIGDVLSISEHTVFKHRKNMLRKMNVKRTGDLLRKAFAQGIV